MFPHLNTWANNCRRFSIQMFASICRMTRQVVALEAGKKQVDYIGYLSVMSIIVKVGIIFFENAEQLLNKLQRKNVFFFLQFTCQFHSCKIGIQAKCTIIQCLHIKQNYILNCKWALQLHKYLGELEKVRKAMYFRTAKLASLCDLVDVISKHTHLHQRH